MDFFPERQFVRQGTHQVIHAVSFHTHSHKHCLSFFFLVRLPPYCWHRAVFVAVGICFYGLVNRLHSWMVNDWKQFVSVLVVHRGHIFVRGGVSFSVAIQNYFKLPHLTRNFEMCMLAMCVHVMVKSVFILSSFGMLKLPFWTPKLSLNFSSLHHNWKWLSN